jgi:hypothetical protein
MPDAPTEPTARGIATRYVLALTGAQVLTAAEVAAVIVSLSSQSFDNTRTLLTGGSLVILVALTVLSLAVTIAARCGTSPRRCDGSSPVPNPPTSSGTTRSTSSGAKPRS